jgi:hypothetical protein
MMAIDFGKKKFTINSYKLTLPEFVSVRISSLFVSILLY